jgi:Zn-dependent M28 family amino/carboxypeptidase
VPIQPLFFALALAVAPNPAARWWSHILFLADDKLEGRNTGSEGHRKAALYVAAEFEKLGLKPAGTQAYIQPVRLSTSRVLESESSLALVRNGAAEPLVLGDDANFGRGQKAVESLEAPLVFAGYALKIPEAGHDDFAGLNVKGKVVVYLSGAPDSLPGPVRAHFSSAGERARMLREAGAVGAIAVQNPKSTDVPWARSTLSRHQVSMSLAAPAAGPGENDGLLSVTANAARAEKWFEGSGRTFAEIAALDRGGKPLPKFPLPASVRARVRVETGAAESQNVAALLPGSDRTLKNEYVVMTAHLDHLGLASPGAAINGDSIYNGAMDNASGIASLIEIAAALRESKTKLRRSILFLAVTGEEKGMLGSRYYAGHPTVPKDKIVANLNCDMFLPLFPLKILTVMGLDESTLGDSVRAAAAALGVAVEADPEPERNRFIRSDQYSFIRGGVPALAFKIGYAKDSPESGIAKKWIAERYHAPSDDVHQPVDFGAAAGFNRLMRNLLASIANADERPQWRPASFFRRFAEATR